MQGALLSLSHYDPTPPSISRLTGHFDSCHPAITCHSQCQIWDRGLSSGPGDVPTPDGSDTL